MRRHDVPATISPVNTHPEPGNLEKPSPRKSRAMAAALLTILPPVLLAGAIPMGGVSALEDDLLYYFPQRVHFGQAIRDGHFPLWNPLTGMGQPLAADPQVGMWYPPTYLFVVLPPFGAYLITLWLHFVLAGAGMYRLARVLRRSRYAALFAAIAFEVGGLLIAHRAHLTIFESAAWLPWILYAWTRVAERGCRRDFCLAVLAFALQLLVQHVQISIITVAIAMATLALMHHRRLRLLWQFPLAVLLSVGIAAIQLVPTFAHFSRCTRSEPIFDMFFENSFWPQSLILLFWPMIFGTRTPNFYATDYWGPSHWCEQAIYPSLAVIVLAMAAVGLGRRDRQVRCWLIVAGLAIIPALGQFNPLYLKLFDLPFFGSFRVPARWMLGVSFVLPLLAATTLDALRKGDQRTRRRVARYACVVLPLLMAGALAGALLLRRIGQIPFNEIADTGVRLTFTEPAVLVPIVLLVLTAAMLAGPGRRTGWWCAGTLVLLIADLASVASFADVDRTTYPGAKALLDSPLADHIKKQDQSHTGRLWVCRREADYHRPLEVLWPNTNLLHAVPTLHAYGPLLTKEYRALWQMRPWGSSDAALDLLCRPALLQAMGVRWVAARSNAERELVRHARRVQEPARISPLLPADHWRPVAGADHLRLGVSLAEIGLYRAEMTVRPRQMGSGTRFYVTLDTAEGQPLTPPRHFEPADLAFGQRRLRMHFFVGKPTASALLRIAAFRGAGVDLSDVSFGPVAVGTTDAPNLGQGQTVQDGLLFELPDPAPRVSFARRAVAVPTIAAALEYLTISGDGESLGDTAVVVSEAGPPPCPETARVLAVQSSPNRLKISVEAPAGGLLVFRDTFDPGWRAALDGQAASLRRTNVLCSSVQVPPNTRQVVLTFWPEGLTVGATLSVLAVLLLLPASMAAGQKPP